MSFIHIVLETQWIEEGWEKIVTDVCAEQMKVEKRMSVIDLNVIYIQ